MSSSKLSAILRSPRQWSIRLRLTALFVTLLGATMLIFSSLLYSVFVRNQQNEFDIELYNHGVDIARAININLFGELTVDTEVLSAGGKIFPFSVGQTFIQILSPNGKIIARSPTLGRAQLPVFTDDWKLLERSGATLRTIEPTEIKALPVSHVPAYRLLTYLVRERPNAGSMVLQIAAPMTFLKQTASQLITFLIIAIPTTLILATFGGLYLSQRAFGPVRAIIQKTKGLNPGNLSERVPVSPARDELRELSLTLNALLDRLEQAFQSQERFISDASHELKTPLAILRGELDLLKSQPRSAEEISEFLASASQELDHLSRMVEDLLLLARVDAGASSISLRPVRLDEIALEVMSRLERLSQARNLKLRFDLLETASERGFEVRGDADLLMSLVKNLIENAIKFSSEGGSIQIKLEDKTDAVELSVRDEGPGISADFLPKIFDRFSRGNPPPAAASRLGVSGSGLGLAIARQIVKAHGGSLEVQSREGLGATFTARFPLA